MTNETRAEKTARSLIEVAQEVALQLKARTNEDMTITKDTIRDTIKVEVNGKIDKVIPQILVQQHLHIPHQRDSVASTAHLLQPPPQYSI